jgi:hypothetical protein
MHGVIEMSLESKIAAAFLPRSKPLHLTPAHEALQATSEMNDAFTFKSLAWAQVTKEHWNQHSGAFFAFSPSAFLYFLPSVLTLSLREPKAWLAPADSLVTVLDRSPNIETWDLFLLQRLVALQSEEYAVLRDWLLQMSECSTFEQDALGRAFDSVYLAEQETDSIRKMISTISC